MSFRQDPVLWQALLVAFDPDEGGCNQSDGRTDTYDFVWR